LRLIKSYERASIVKCSLGDIHFVLVSVALTNPPVVALDVSGSVARIRKRIEQRTGSATTGLLSGAI
jgi:hypothetical protein